jgi:hypothetical protein
MSGYSGPVVLAVCILTAALGLGVWSDDVTVVGEGLLLGGAALAAHEWGRREREEGGSRRVRFLWLLTLILLGLLLLL